MKLRQQESPVLLLGVGIKRVARDKPLAHQLQHMATGRLEIVGRSIRIDERFEMFRQRKRRRLNRHCSSQPFCSPAPPDGGKASPKPTGTTGRFSSLRL